MMTKTVPCMVILALLLSYGICTGAVAGRGPTVLIVSGISKDPNDQATKTKAVSDLRDYLLKHMNVEPQRLVILTADKPAVASALSLQSTASEVSRIMDSLTSAVRPEDRFIFYYLGQANAIGGELRFNLPGPDMTQKELAERLNAIRAGALLVVLDCPCAALAAKALTGPNRIIVCASAATQPLGTRFSPHFVHALTQPQTDANNDGRVSLLEAFTATAREIEQWYRQREILPTETPCLEDDGDGAASERPWKYRAEGGDGVKASTFLLVEGR
jgi:hypothetical protein